MRVFRQKKVDLAQYKLKGKDENLLDNNLVADEQGGIAVGQGEAPQQKKGKGGVSNNVLLGLGAVAVVGFLIMKNKKK